MANNEGMCKHCGAAVLFVKDDRWHVFDAKPSEEGEWRIRSRWAANVAAEKTTVTRLAESKLRRARLMGEPLFARTSKHALRTTVQKFCRRSGDMDDASIADEWWENLPDRRKIQIHHWIVSPRQITIQELPGQIALIEGTEQ